MSCLWDIGVMIDDDNSLQDMKRPFSPMKALNMEVVVSEIIDKLNGGK